MYVRININIYIRIYTYVCMHVCMCMHANVKFILITAPGKVDMVTVKCTPVDMINQCNITWNVSLLVYGLAYMCTVLISQARVCTWLCL